MGLFGWGLKRAVSDGAKEKMEEIHEFLQRYYSAEITSPKRLTDYLQDQFSLDRDEARAITMDWWTNYRVVD